MWIPVRNIFGLWRLRVKSQKTGFFHTFLISSLRSIYLEIFEDYVMKNDKGSIIFQSQKADKSWVL